MVDMDDSCQFSADSGLSTGLSKVVCFESYSGNTDTQTHNSRAHRLLYLAIKILYWYAIWTFNFLIPESNSCLTCASYSIYFCYLFCRREVTSRVHGNHYHAHLYSE